MFLFNLTSCEAFHDVLETSIARGIKGQARLLAEDGDIEPF